MARRATDCCKSRYAAALRPVALVSLVSLLASSAGGAVLAAAPAPVISVLAVSGLDNATSREVGATMLVRVQGATAAELARCIARADRPLRRHVDPARSFAAVRWTRSEEQSLARCGSASCRYNFSGTDIVRLMRQPTLAAKKSEYYAIVRDATLAARKASKPHRIRPDELSREPCAGSGSSWLLDGELKPHDQLAWRKFTGSDRMQPTMMTTQVRAWQQGNAHCVGKVLLFADHYYDDHLELYQFQPQGSSVLLRYHTRSRLDIFRSWWARRFRGTISDSLRGYESARLRRILATCKLG